MLPLAVATLAIMFAAAAFAVRLPDRGVIFFLTVAALGTWSMIMVTVGFAGLVLRDLSPTVLFTLACIWPAAAALSFIIRRPKPPHVRARLRRGARVARDTLSWPPVAIAFAVIVVMLLWRTFLALRMPVIDYDGWSYHLVTVDVWLQANEIVRVPQRIWTDGNPSNGEVLTTWLMAFDRRDALAGFTSILPIPLAIVATAGLARSFGASRRTALLCALLFGATPALVALAGTSYVDVCSVAAVLSAWYLGLRFIGGDRDWQTTLFLALAAGIAAGTKFTGFLLLGPLLIVVGLMLLGGLGRAWRTGGPVSGRIGQLAVLVVPVVVLGGTWYFKNIIIHGNPLYPIALGPLPGATTFEGLTITVPKLEGLDPARKVLASWVADWTIDRYNYNVRPGGFGRAWLAIIPFAIAGLLLLVRQRRWWPIGLIVIPAVLTLIVMPENWYARLTLFVPGLALALTAVALDALRPRIQLLSASALLVLAIVSVGLADVRPNVDIRGSDVGAGPRRVSPRQYLAFLLQPSEQRASLGLARECAGFRQIPPGARVAPGGFNLLHGVVGPDLDRILTSSIGHIARPSEIAPALRELDASWLVTRAGSDLDTLASMTPELIGHGEICQGGRLWSVAPP